MAPLTYAAPSYALGDSNSQVTRANAQASFKGMQSTLKSWLRYRNIVNGAALGKSPDEIQKLRQDRFKTEQDLANTLHALLVECGASAAALPVTDVSVDADAAAKLAEIAILGKCPADAAHPAATGAIWWLIAIPVAGVVLIASAWISSKAEVAKEAERLRCVQSGACTDSGFWIKVGAVAVTAFVAQHFWKAHKRKKS